LVASFRKEFMYWKHKKPLEGPQKTIIIVVDIYIENDNRRGEKQSH
jgi:hypothetical protein